MRCAHDDLTLNNQDVSHLCEGNVQATTRRRSVGKLEAKLLRKDVPSFSEGDSAVLAIDGKILFKGFVFKCRTSNTGLIDLTCYDQIIYLKLNKETYVYENRTAAEVVRMIAGDFGLNVGRLAETIYRVPQRVEDIQTLLDIIYTALDLTTIHTGNLFVLYDNAGALTLENIQQMRLNKILSAYGNLEDYRYTTDIGTDTFNQIKLVRDNEETGRRDVFIEKDSANIARWGRLQLHQKVSDNFTEGQVINLVQRKLAVYNRVKRSLMAKELAGDANVRAGNALMVEIPDLHDINLNTWLVIERCTHIISNSSHRMELDFSGDF